MATAFPSDWSYWWLVLAAAALIVLMVWNWRRRQSGRVAGVSPADYIVRFRLDKAKLAALPEDERCILLLAGHISNELGFLQALVLFTLRQYSNRVEEAYTMTRAWVVLRLLIGKVGETLVFISKRIQGGRFNPARLQPLLRRDAALKTAYDRVNGYIGGSGILQRVRNEHVFHHPNNAEVEAAFRAVDASEDWSLYTSVARHTTVCDMSHEVMIRALLQAVGADPIKAVTQLRDEVLDAADAILTFFEILLPAMLAQADAVSSREAVLRITNDMPSARDYRLPPIFR
jgi:hypothetical protein